MLVCSQVGIIDVPEGSRAVSVLQQKRECVGEERAAGIITAAAKDVHSVLVAIYSQA